MNDPHSKYCNGEKGGELFIPLSECGKVTVKMPFPTTPINNLPGSLNAAIAEHGSARAAAAHWGISEAYLSQIRNGHKDVPEWLGMALGWRKIWIKP